MIDNKILYQSLLERGISDPSGLVAQANVFGTRNNVMGLRDEDIAATGIDASDTEQSIQTAISLESNFLQSGMSEGLVRAAMLAGQPEAVKSGQLSRIKKEQRKVKRANEPKAPKAKKTKPFDSAALRELAGEIFDKVEGIENGDQST